MDKSPSDTTTENYGTAWGSSYSPYKHQPSMVAPGDAQAHHDPEILSIFNTISTRHKIQWQHQMVQFTLEIQSNQLRLVRSTTARNIFFRQLNNNSPHLVNLHPLGTCSLTSTTRKGIIFKLNSTSNTQGINITNLASISIIIPSNHPYNSLPQGPIVACSHGW